MRLILFYLPFFFISLTSPIFSQKKRLEIPVASATTQHYIFPMGENGVVAVSQTSGVPAEGVDTWVFTCYNTELEKLAERCIEIEARFSYRRYDTDGTDIYFIFHRPGGVRYHFIKFDAITGSLARFSQKSVEHFEVGRFKAIGGYGFLLGEVRNTPTLLHLALRYGGGQVKALPVSTNRHSESATLVKDTVNRLVNFTFANQSHHGAALAIQAYSPSGERLANISLHRQEGYCPLTGKLAITKTGNALVAGTYGSRVGKKATGIYVAKFDGNEQRYFRRHNLTDLEHFFDHLPKKKRERLERRRQRREERGKDLELPHHLLVHDLIYRNGEYLLLAEAYSPSYRYKRIKAGGRFNRRRGRAKPGMVFDGYQYTHAAVAAFEGGSGRLLWDNSFELTSPKTSTLHQKVHLGLAAGGELRMAYSNRGELRAKVIRGNQVVGQAQSVSLRGENDGAVKHVFTEAVGYWYGHYFLAWGKQQIKDLDGGPGDKRNVFYLNRVPFDALSK